MFAVTCEIGGEILYSLIKTRDDPSTITSRLLRCAILNKQSSTAILQIIRAESDREGQLLTKHTTTSQIGLLLQLSLLACLLSDNLIRKLLVSYSYTNRYNQSFMLGEMLQDA